MMIGELQDAADTIASFVGAFEPGHVEGHEARRLVEVFGSIEKLAIAGRTLAAGRVAETGGWRGSGQPSASHWMAVGAGTTVRAAATAIETARRLEQLPAVREAFVTGKLSEIQATEIASAAAMDTSSEQALLAAAEHDSVVRLRERCRAVRASVVADEMTCERIREGRYLRRWTDHDGALRLDARLAPDDGAGLIGAIEARATQLFLEAKRAGTPVAREACAADALVSMTEGAARTVVHVEVDAGAWERGHTIAGERCVIRGVGPVPVSAARRLANQGNVKMIERDGVDVRRVVHVGRTIPSPVRTALEARDPQCVVSGCGIQTGLEIDHIEPLARGGLTTLDNLARLCRFHHAQKTHHGWELGGKPGAWTWTRKDRAP